MASALPNTLIDLTFSYLSYDQLIELVEKQTDAVALGLLKQRFTSVCQLSLFSEHVCYKLPEKDDFKVFDEAIGPSTVKSINVLTHKILMAIHCLPSPPEDPQLHSELRVSLMDFYEMAIKQRAAEVAIMDNGSSKVNTCILFSRRQGMVWQGKMDKASNLKFQSIPRKYLNSIKEGEVFKFKEILLRACQLKWATKYIVLPLTNKPFETFFETPVLDKVDQKQSDSPQK